MSYKRGWWHCLFLSLLDLSHYKHLIWDSLLIYQTLTALKPPDLDLRTERCA